MFGKGVVKKGGDVGVCGDEGEEFGGKCLRSKIKSGHEKLSEPYLSWGS